MERRRSGRRRHGSKIPLGHRIKEYGRQFIAFMFSNVGIIGLVVSYTIAGAFMFIAIEGESARNRVNNVKRMRMEAVQQLWQYTCCTVNTFNETEWMQLVANELRSYQEKVIKAVKTGWDGTEDTEDSFQWSFSGAFLYSLTVITTIGYGNISPRTEWGKVITILYAIIGMPLFLLYLSNIGDVLARSFKWVYAMIFLCRGCPGVARRRAERNLGRRIQDRIEEHVQDWVDHPQHYHSSTSMEGVEKYMMRRASRIESTYSVAESTADSDMTVVEYDPQTVIVPITICVTFMVGYMLFGAALFAKWEDWDAIDGSYFCFISLSSIGFGDIVPGDQIYAAKKIEISFIVCSMYLMLGMALIAMCFNLMQEQVIHHFAAVKRVFYRTFHCER